VLALKRWLSVTFLGIIALLPLPGSAETYGHVLERMCQNGDKIKDLDRRISEADAMQDSIRYQLHHDEAREYFRCSTTATNPYDADIATLLYTTELESSARTNGEEDERGHTAASAANELAAATRFDDIRRRALITRDVLRKAADTAHNAIYGASAPSPSAALVPTDTPTP
jgi:hypothetical protein